MKKEKHIKRIKKIFALSVIFSMVFHIFLYSAVFSVYADAAAGDPDIPPVIQAEAAIMINIDTGEVVYDKNSTVKMFPASTVKIMTAILAIEHFADDFEQQIIVKPEAVKNVLGNNMAIQAEEIFTVNDLLYGLIIHGANDAAAVFAYEVGGSMENFIIKMNEKAAALGCTNTVFANPSGLHNSGMYTTAEDMAKIAAHAYTLQKFMEVSSTPAYTIKATNKTSVERPYSNRNHLVSKAARTGYFYEYARGMNAGSTSEGGYCLVSSAEQKGMKYLVVILKSTAVVLPNTTVETVYSFKDAKSLFEWIFSIFAYKTVLSSKKVIDTVKVELSANNDTIGLIAEKDLEYMLPVNADLEKDIVKTYRIYEDKLYAPIEKGDEVGEITVAYKDKIIGTRKLLSNTSVERSEVLYILEQIKDVISRKWFKAGAITFVICLIFYIVISIISANKNARKRFR